MRSKKFEINKYLSLELWGGKTFIYVNGKKFKQCKYVLLNITSDDMEQYSAINSIDEIIGISDHSLEEYPELITPEVEFWAHSSNLQAWAENGYNTDLLDSALSFPLLKELMKEGDVKAKKVFKEEIAKRLMRGELNTVGYLVSAGFLKFLTLEELITIFSSSYLLFENIFNTFKNGDTDQVNLADQIFMKLGGFLYYPIKRKLQQIFNTEDVEELLIFFNYDILDELSDEDIVSLFDPPISLLEKALKILNRINLKEIDIGERELISKRVEIVLGGRIKNELLSIIYKRNTKFDVLWSLNLLKYLKNEETDYQKYLK